MPGEKSTHATDSTGNAKSSFSKSMLPVDSDTTWDAIHNVHNIFFLLNSSATIYVDGVY